MSAPHGVFWIIDRAVAELDASLLGGDYEGDATASWSSILEVWQRFKSLVDRLDRAVIDPLAPEAPTVLSTAQRLTEADAVRLAFWLPHVGTALIRRPHRT